MKAKGPDGKPTYWQTKLLGAVKSAANEGWLERIFDASGCREGWMQGELFLRFPDRLRVNEVPLGRGIKADLSADLRLSAGGKLEVTGERPMVGEVKVLSAGFQSKTITGASLRPFQALAVEDGRTNVTLSWAKSRVGPWGLIPDYVRLAGARALPPKTERILILVARTGGGVAKDAVGDALARITFDGALEHETALHDFGFARAWSF